MDQYLVGHRYTSRRDGITFGPWIAGDVITLEPGDAEWIERDSPGTLRPVDQDDVEPVEQPPVQPPAAQPAPAAAKPTAATRPARQKAQRKAARG